MENSSYKSHIRNKSCDMFNNILDDNRKSRQIEKDIYNSCLKYSTENSIVRSWENEIFKSLYVSRIRSIYTNLKTDSYLGNKNFSEKIKDDKIDYKNISKLSKYDIYPEVWSELLSKQAEKDKLKYSLKPEAMTDMFKCRKCGSRSCSYYEFQTRSADEPMTQFITCLDCNNNWKQ
jgi:DNA-directed RNA polymerase subunit M/transcription elongation factor TFIIS